MYYAVRHIHPGWTPTRGTAYNGAGTTVGVYSYYFNGRTAAPGGRRWDVRFGNTPCAFHYYFFRSIFFCNDAVYDKVLHVGVPNLRHHVHATWTSPGWSSDNCAAAPGKVWSRWSTATGG